MKLTADLHEHEISSMHSTRCLVHEKLNNLLSKRNRDRSGRGQIHGVGINAALKKEIENIIQILIPDDEDDPHDWSARCHDTPPEWGSGTGW